jgi:hypothetical protein
VNHSRTRHDSDVPAIKIGSIYCEKIMIGYITVGTNDLPKAVAFYDVLLAELGAAHFRDLDGNKPDVLFMHTAES